MYTSLCSKLAVTDAKDEFSPAVSMAGNNAVQIEATLFNNTATSLTVDLQGSNDGQNFSSITVYPGFLLGYNAPNKSTGIGFEQVRLRYAVVGSGVIIVAAGINTSFQ